MAGDDGLEELIAYVAAEANHESSRRRQQQLDTAFDVLSAAARSIAGG
jgi:plasmid stabilization system protein ParE